MVSATTPSPVPGTSATPRPTGPQNFGLRERKKRQTRDALIEAAHRLFATHGYEGTTTDQIAAAVDVSQRTLFRYFANKDDIALAPLDEVQDSLHRAVRDRPAGEAPMTALRAAVRVVWQELVDARAPADSLLPAFVETLKLVERSPALLAANLRRQAEREQRLAEVIADREGLDPATDPRPQLAVAVFDAALRVATNSWCSTDREDLTSILSEMEACLDQLPTVLGRWRRPARG